MCGGERRLVRWWGAQGESYCKSQDAMESATISHSPSAAVAQGEGPALRTLQCHNAYDNLCPQPTISCPSDHPDRDVS